MDSAYIFYAGDQALKFWRLDWGVDDLLSGEDWQSEQSEDAVGSVSYTVDTTQLCILHSGHYSASPCQLKRPPKGWELPALGTSQWIIFYLGINKKEEVSSSAYYGLAQNNGYD